MDLIIDVEVTTNHFISKVLAGDDKYLRLNLRTNDSLLEIVSLDVLEDIGNKIIEN